MGVEPLFKTMRNRHVTNKSGFRIDLFNTESYDAIKAADRNKIYSEFADQMRPVVQSDGTTKEVLCLGNDLETVKRNLEDEEYSLIGIVEQEGDKAVGSLQYYDWCGTDTPQLWINDVCRITKGKKSAVSPVKILLEEFEQLAKKKHLDAIYLMIEDKPPEHEVLPRIYASYGYRKLTKEEGCVMEGVIAMKKDFRRSATRKKRRKISISPHLLSP